MSPSRRGSLVSSDRLAQENTRLKHDLEASNDAFEREVALRVRGEAERTLEKVEELWRVSAENERLKAELEAAKALMAREQQHVALLHAGMAELEHTQAAYPDALAAERAETAAARADAAAARAETATLADTLAKLNRHAVGLCNSCGHLYSNHRKLETAAYRSRSPRFGKAFEHAASGGKAADNAALSAGQGLPGPGSHRTHRDCKGNLVATGLTGTAEPYSPSPSPCTSSVAVNLA